MTAFRSEIQALRALAVMLVVLFHLWPDILTGGYIGVDVFFAISGYLITGMLLREGDSTGTIRLGAFWARRIRRLLPAAALVLAASVLGTALFLPQRLWQETAIQIGGSALGIQNWVLAVNSVDYFGANNLPSVVQHYWSLSLEEQFYLFWPVVLLLLFLVTRKSSRSARTSSIGRVMILVFILSLGWSVIATGQSQAAAYFSTFTHGWEFALGGVLALMAKPLMESRWGALQRTRAIASWVGLAVIIGSAVFFTARTAFPGWIALLPILGTLVVIAAGQSTSRIQSPLLMRWKPVQLLGGASYSIYLWHWPLIVIMPFALGHKLGFGWALGILVASIVLGRLTQVFIEDPARASRILNHRVWINYAVAAGTATALMVSAFTVWNVAAAQAAADQNVAKALTDSALASANTCFGAPAMEHPGACPASHEVLAQFGPNFAANDWGSLAGVTKDGTLPDKSRCVDFSTDHSGFLDCTLGDLHSATTMAIVGDSHALALTEPLVRVAVANGWKVRAFLRNSCSASLPMDYTGVGTKADCNRWRAAVAQRISADRTIDKVVTTGFTRGEPEAAFVGNRADLVNDYAGLWRMWTKSGKQVFVIEDVPLTSGQSVPECVAAHMQLKDPCTVARTTALAYDPVVAAVAAAASHQVSLIDLTSAFCDAKVCHSVIGGLIAYRDFHHLSGTFALTLIPAFERALVPTLKTGG